MMFLETFNPLDVVRAAGHLVAVLGACMAVPDLARADMLPVPEGPVILTITGEIAATNGDGRAEFDRNMLEALPQTVVRTRTPWADGPVVFEGLLMRDLLALVGSRGAAVKATALNDYSVEIPVSDFEVEDVILALRKGGDYLTVREKGPLWIIYPLGDDLSELETPAKMVWQLRWMDVREQ